MKENLTEIVFIVDESGSMHSLKSDTIGGFNSLLEQQKNAEGDAIVTVVMFNHQMKTLFQRVPIEKVPELTSEDYTPAGTTALYDTVGNLITRTQQMFKYCDPEEVPEKILFIITTDGMDNASHEFNSKSIKELIEKQKGDGWEFMFIGANMDASNVAQSIGISEDMSVEYLADSEGTKTMFGSVNAAISGLRMNKAVSKTWKAAVDDDRKRRKK